MSCKTPQRQHPLVLFASFIIIIAGMRTAQEIVAPILLAIFIAVIAAPAVFWLQNKGLPRLVAFFMVALGVVGILSIMVIMIGNALDTFISQLPNFQDRLMSLLQKANAFFPNNGAEIDFLQTPEYLQPAQLLSTTTSILRSLSKLLSSSFLIFLIVAFILFETTSLRVKMRLLLGNDSKETEGIMNFIENLKHYLLIKSISSLATGIIIGLLLWVFGVKYAILFGLIAFLLNYIPAIGSIVASIPAILVSLIEYDTSTTVAVIAIFLVVNVLIGNILEPRFLGKGLGLSPLVVLLSLIFWGWVLGPIGMFLAVPITMSIAMALHTLPHTKWIAILLSS
ncbi:MAG: AI-2E family transporter [Sulfurospirillaceae bacterium]|nr:AI-2E family transporter [Sulfurospirillaceae bacterium]